MSLHSIERKEYGAPNRLTGEATMADAVRIRLGVALVALASSVACGQSSCSLVKNIPGHFDPDKRVEHAVQARVSAAGVHYFEQNFNGLLSAFVPDGLNQSITPDCTGNPKLCCESPDPQCVAAVQVTGLALEPDGGSSVGFTTRAHVSSSSKHGATFPFAYTVSILFVDTTIGCLVSVDTARTGKPDLGVTGVVRFERSADATGMARAVTKISSLTDLDDDDVVISGGVVCDVADVLKGFFMDTVRDQVQAKIGDAINQQLCQPCASSAECGPFGQCSDGTCMRGSQCLQRFQLEGRVELADLVPDLTAGVAPEVDVYTVPGPSARTPAGGLSLDLWGGIEPARTSSCVPAQDAPPLGVLTPTTTLEGDINPTNQQGYQVGIGVHREFLQYGAWAGWQSGTLCFSLGTDASPLLTSSTLAFIAPSLGALTGGQSRPLRVDVRPLELPQLTLGRGLFTTDGDGITTLTEPLVTANFTDFQADVYVQLDNGFTRVLTVTADIALPLGLDVDEQNHLVPLLGDLTGKLTNFRVTNSQLLTEAPSDLATRIPAILTIALPAVARSLPQFTLPSYNGIELSIDHGNLTSVDSDGVLALFANIKLAGQGTPAPAVHTHARVVGIDPGAAPERVTVRSVLDLLALVPKVHIQIDPAAMRAPGDEGVIEWQFRIDGGFWSPFHLSTSFVVDDLALLLPGVHKIEVRARKRGSTASLDPKPVAFLVKTGANPQVMAGPHADSSDGETGTLVTPDTATAAPATGCTVATGRAAPRLSWFALAGLGLALLVRARRGRKRHH
jgi:hypothetical protein